MKLSRTTGALETGLRSENQGKLDFSDAQQQGMLSRELRADPVTRVADAENSASDIEALAAEQLQDDVESTATAADDTSVISARRKPSLPKNATSEERVQYEREMADYQLEQTLTPAQLREKRYTEAQARRDANDGALVEPEARKQTAEPRYEHSEEDVEKARALWAEGVEVDESSLAWDQLDRDIQDRYTQAVKDQINHPSRHIDFAKLDKQQGYLTYEQASRKPAAAAGPARAAAQAAEAVERGAESPQSATAARRGRAGRSAARPAGREVHADRSGSEEAAGRRPAVPPAADDSGAESEASIRSEAVGRGEQPDPATSEARAQTGTEREGQDEDGLTPDEMAQQWDAAAQEASLPAFAALNAEHRNYILGSANWDEFNEAANEVAAELAAEDTTGTITTEQAGLDVSSNPVENRVARLRPRLGEKQSARLDKLVARYTDGEIDFGRFDTELEELEARAAQGVKYAVGAANPDIAGQRMTPLAEEFDDGAAAARWLAQNGATPAIRQIAAKIAPYVSGVNVHFLSPGDRVNDRDVARVIARAIGVFNPAPTAGGEVYIRRDAGNYQENLLHELLHAATYDRLSTPEGAALFEPLRTAVRTTLSTDQGRWPINDKEKRSAHEFYREMFQDVHEFVAYGFSSPSAQELFRRIAADGRWMTEHRAPGALNRVTRQRGVAKPLETVPALSLWQRFVDAVRSLFGLPKVYARAIEEIIERNAAISEANRAAAQVEYVPVSEALGGLLDRLLTEVPVGHAGPTTQGPRAQETAAQGGVETVAESLNPS